MLAAARAKAARGVVDEAGLCDILRTVVAALDTRLTVNHPDPPPSARTEP